MLDIIRASLAKTRGEYAPLVLSPETPKHVRTQALLAEPGRSIVILDSTPDGRFSLEELSAVLRLCRLARIGTASTGSVVVVEPDQAPATDPERMRLLGESAELRIVEASQSSMVGQPGSLSDAAT